MIQCPECRNMIPDDSAFCDQCGKELKWCPQCRRPKRGTECPVCGSDLVSGVKYISTVPGKSISPKVDTTEPPQPSPAPQPQAERVSTLPDSVAVEGPAALVGNGWRLAIKEGPFGRNGGIWPELSTCQYVSGNHGRIEKNNDSWFIVDNGSTNGTFIDGNRITKEILRKGSRVRIATLDFIVE